MKRILIALDYNPTAQKVAEMGFSLAKTLKAEVILLHVIQEPIFYSSTAYNPIMGFGGYLNLDLSEPNMRDEVIKMSQQFLDSSKTYLGDITLQTLIKEGNAADSILEAAKEERADIIVIGTHSRRWLEKIVMGSVAEEVLQNTTTPIFIIPTKKQE